MKFNIYREKLQPLTETITSINFCSVILQQNFYALRPAPADKVSKQYNTFFLPKENHLMKKYEGEGISSTTNKVHMYIAMTIKEIFSLNN